MFLVCANSRLALWATFLLGKIDHLLLFRVSNWDRQKKKIKKQAFLFRISATLMWLPRHCLETQTLQHIWKSTVEWNWVLKQHVKLEKFMFMLKQQCSNRFQWKQEECIRDGNGLLPWMQVQEFRPTVWADCMKRKLLLSVRANQTFGSGTCPSAHMLVCTEPCLHSCVLRARLCTLNASFCPLVVCNWSFSRVA